MTESRSDADDIIITGAGAGLRIHAIERDGYLSREKENGKSRWLDAVVDCSFFVSITAVNPALTVAANATQPRSAQP